jgi:hypothetical protein
LFCAFFGFIYFISDEGEMEPSWSVDSPGVAAGSGVQGAAKHAEKLIF